MTIIVVVVITGPVSPLKMKFLPFGSKLMILLFIDVFIGMDLGFHREIQ